MVSPFPGSRTHERFHLVNFQQNPEPDPVQEPCQVPRADGRDKSTPNARRCMLILERIPQLRRSLDRGNSGYSLKSTRKKSHARRHRGRHHRVGVRREGGLAVGADAHFKPLFHPKARFTDDTVLTVAVAESILYGGDLVNLFKEYAGIYPGAGYGGTFRRWAASESRKPYQSWGNGSASAREPRRLCFDDSLDEVLRARSGPPRSPTTIPRGSRYAQATAAAVFLARTGSDKEQIRDYVERKFGYRLDGADR